MQAALPMAPRATLIDFFQTSARLVDSDSAIRQQVIEKLASDGGISRIRELVGDCNSTGNLLQQQRRFVGRVLPFFKTISHPDVLSSLILEQDVAHLYGILYGGNGATGIKVFSFVTEFLDKCYEDRQDVDNLAELSDQLAAVTCVLSKMVESAGGAQINPSIADLVQKLAKFLSDIVSQHGEPNFHGSVVHMGRLQRRLELGSSFPTFESKPKKQVPRPTFHLQQDLPGGLSKHGRRHDNDSENIQDIKILPTWKEILSPRSEHLPLNDPSTWHKSGMEGLIDRQFRLLREDTIGQLRDAIRVDRLRGNSAIARKDQSLRTHTYRDAVLVGMSVDRREGIKCTIRFPQPEKVRGKSKKARTDWWRMAKRLQRDAFVCLYNDKDLLQFCTVGGEERKETPESINQDAAPQADKIWDLTTDKDFAYVVIQILDCSARSIRSIVSLRAKFVLVEFPGVLFPSFEPTLQALKRMTKSPGDVPFAEFLSPEDQSSGEMVSVPPPSYAQKQGFRFDLKSATKGNSSLFLHADRFFDHEKLDQASELDEAQSKAVVDSLSRRLALIQGPPGTGKSYTGVALIKILLDNRKAAKLGPIICVCYTNHALDQLLDHLLDENVGQIVRIGSQSKSERLKALNLREVCRKIDRTKVEKHRDWEIRTRLDDHTTSISTLLSTLENPSSPRALKKYLIKFYPQHYSQLFSKQDEEGFTKVQRDKNSLESWIRQGAQIVPMQSERPVDELKSAHLYTMTYAERRSILSFWVREITRTTTDEFVASVQRFTDDQRKSQKYRMETDLRCLQQAHVVGVTTSGMARNMELLRRVGNKVLVCEEAGQVLESHLLTALLPSVEHAILIGDHLQLRPQINRYELQQQSRQGEPYSLDVSLLERLVQPPLESAIKLPFVTLETQRRMHPSISQLVRDTLYPNLKDEPRTAEYPQVSGMKRRLFWLDHSHPEDGSGEEETTSRSNNFEVEMVSALVSHLIRQGVYGAQDIAVITPYLGQLFKLRSRLGRTFELVVNERDLASLENEGLVSEDQPAAKAAALNTLKVATIDNFQGEEAKVVVISLVRSNKENKCGFLRTPNRINVLLSRAQHGMYVVGNARTSRGVKMWADILGILETNGNIGPELELQCSRHLETPITVSNPDDFPRFSPEGGCSLKCDKRLVCGHACVKRCHSDLLHNAEICQEACPRKLPGCDHPCPWICGNKCPQKCIVNVHVPNRRLPCGHSKPDLPCWQSQDLSTFRCDRKVERKIPGCNHTLDLPCHVDFSSDEFRCPRPCGSNLACGHVCKKQCASCRTREGAKIVKEDHGSCSQVCGRQYNTCRHSCSSVCHGEQPCPLCSNPCEVSCSHSKCQKMCFEPCSPCAVSNCSTGCEHGRCSRPCSAPCDWLPCSKRCLKNLECGHQCMLNQIQVMARLTKSGPSLCGEICPPRRFCHACATQAVKDQEVDFILMSTYGDIDPNEDPCVFPPCGHILTVESMDGIMSMSEHYDISENRTITSIKPASAQPFSSNQVKRCPKCRGSLRSISRYGRIVRRDLLDESTKKFIVWSQNQYTELSSELNKIQGQLVSSLDGVKVTASKETVKIKLSGDLFQQKKYTADMAKFLGLVDRYYHIKRTRERINTHSVQVRKEEQPFHKVFTLCEDARRRRQRQTSFEIPREAVQTGAHIRAQALFLRCDLGLLSDLLSIWQNKLSNANRPEAEIDLSQNRKACLRLLRDATASGYALQMVEAHVFFARYAAIEVSTAVKEKAKADELCEEGKSHIESARKVCERHASAETSMMKEIEDTERMLRESTFYSVVTSEEMRAVVAAMSREFTGTGHWYYCQNGHPFTIGECGGPVQTTACPECGAPVGGRDHRVAQGVRRAEDLESEFGRLNLR
ncbi:putative NF-X1 finger and helicase domain protein [Phyllosticta capitalensis]